MANTLKFGNGEWYGKKDTILAYNDENYNYKPLPFNFSRDSKATVINKDGLIETVGIGMPRIDYKDDSKGALLLEPSRSNSIIYSEDVISWNAHNSITRSNNADISPDGTLNACTIIGTNNTTFNSIRQTFSVSSNSTNTFSMFIKKVETETNYLGVGMVYAGGTTDVAYVSFDSVNGIARSMDVRIDAKTNVVDFGDYWRLEVTSTDDQNNTILTLDVYATLSTDGFNTSVGASSLRTIWGMQLELNSSYATSYIPTQGSTVTRLADSCSQTPPSGVIGQTEGTIYAEAKINGLKDSNTIVTLHNGSFSEYLVIAGNSSGNINAYIFAGGVQQAGILSGTIYSVDSIVKCAMAYKENDVAFYINGVLIGTDSSATMASTSFFDVGSISFGNYPLNGSVKQTKLYNTRLSNNELASLTTI